jgi:hypothetical protein
MYQAVHWLFPVWFELVNEIIPLIIGFYNFIFTLKQPSRWWEEGKPNNLNIDY